MGKLFTRMKAPAFPSSHGALVEQSCPKTLRQNTFFRCSRKWPLGVNEWHSRGKVSSELKKNRQYKKFKKPDEQ